MPDLHQTISAPIGSVNVGSSRIARALEEAARLDDTILSNVRCAVCDYVLAQRSADTPPEAIIARVKAIALASYAADAPRDVRDAIMARVVAWCIDAYYGERRSDGPIT